MIQIGDAGEEEKPRFARLKTNQSIETITLEEALDLFKLPRNIGQFEDQDVAINIGRFGPYAAHDKKFYSLDKNMDPYSVTLEEVIPLIGEKRKAKDERTIKTFPHEKIQILKGPYGPYIKQGLRNYKLTKEQQERAQELTIEEVKKDYRRIKSKSAEESPEKEKINFLALLYQACFYCV